ncbi:MAG: CBS domain-containing protein [Anaerolineales bacterium]|nr:CBS domain-containing protein [Anaerolineales bacterium]MCB9128230.1 CBS domain-containing protein [Ardenticatenales bacterium]
MKIILTHDHTDFDAVASQFGAWKLNPDWQPVVGRYLNRNVQAFLTLHGQALPFVPSTALPDEPVEALMLVDSQSTPSLKGVDLSTVRSVRVVDHHERRDSTPDDWALSLHSTGSCATIFVERMIEQRLTLSWVEATLMLLGIHEDTGSLVYGGTTARDVRAAAWLMEQGADLDTLRAFLDHPLDERQQQLYRSLLEGVEALTINGFVVVVATGQSEKYVSDVSTLANNIRQLYDPAAIILVAQMGNHIQLVARSATDEINVGALMKRFGGGGHARAAAAFVEDESLDEVTQRLRAWLPEEVRPSLTVNDLMSRGRIRTFVDSQPISDAHAAMQRWGHEGFPVLSDGGAVVGLLTRRDVDRAMQHGLGGAKIREFMQRGTVAVTPRDSVAHVRRVMTSENIGQLAVVDAQNGEMLGIVTRTDLLRHSAPLPEEHPRRQRIRKLLEAQINEPTLALMRQIAERATALGHTPYLVGGLVRDLLLDRPLNDLDIVIEGNAIPIARALADEMGGRIVAHRRFGTAKWLLDDEAHPPQVALLRAAGLPEHIDLISARAEFYSHPTALPQVDHASIKQDLHRRDFTINTLAISLAPADEGRLLDFYGGLADLESGVLRVLHNLSFVDDPTRILRAVRFEQRLGFQIEPRTEALLQASLDLLAEVSPDRLRHELYRILTEPASAAIFARMDQLGILGELLPDVRWEAGDSERLSRLRAAGYDDPPTLLTALIWDLAAGKARIQRIAARVALPNQWRTRLLAMHTLRQNKAPIIEPALSNSALYEALQGYEPLVLALVATMTDSAPFRDRLRHYLDELRHRELAISGELLAETGLPPSHHYTDLLRMVHHAMLDGDAPDEASQRALLFEAAARLRDGAEGAGEA